MSETTKNLLPGFYEIVNLQIATLEGNMASIASIVVGFSLIESMQNDSIRGEIDILDTSDLLYNLPLRGEERILMTVKDPLGGTRTLDLFVYKISDITPGDQLTTVRMKLHFTSRARFMSGLTRIRRSFNDLTANIALDIFDEHYKPWTDKQFHVQETEGDLKCIIPNLRPHESMKFLAERSYSSQTPGNMFRFFEGMQSFFFCSDEWLVQEGLKEDPPLRLTFNYPSERSGADLMREMSSAKSLAVVAFNDSVRDLNAGTYKHTIREVDLQSGMIEDKEFDYTQNGQAFIRPQDDAPAHSDMFSQEIAKDPLQKTYFIFKDFASLGDPPTSIRAYDYSSEILSGRVGYAGRARNTVLNVTTHGRLDLNAGRLVHLTLPPFAGQSKLLTNGILTGFYLIDTVFHSFGMDKYECNLTLTRYDWAQGEVTV